MSLTDKITIISFSDLIIDIILIIISSNQNIFFLKINLNDANILFKKMILHTYNDFAYWVHYLFLATEQRKKSFPYY